MFHVKSKIFVKKVISVLKNMICIYMLMLSKNWSIDKMPHVMNQCNNMSEKNLNMNLIKETKVQYLKTW